jgi:hypothetical protein
MRARTAGRWPWNAAQCSAVLPSLCNAKGGGGVGVDQGVAPTPRSRCPSVPRLAAQGVARVSFLF